MIFDLSTNIKNYITSHQSIQELTRKLKELKSNRTALESEIAKYLNENNVTVVNVPKYRLYRYNERLILYHLKEPMVHT